MKKVYVVIRKINHYSHGLLTGHEFENHGIFTSKEKADELATIIKEQYNDYYNDAFVTEVETDREVIF